MGNPIWQYRLVTTILQNAFSAIADSDGCAWGEAELLRSKDDSFSAGCRFWGVLVAAGLKAFRKGGISRSVQPELNVAILRQEQEVHDSAP